MANIGQRLIGFLLRREDKPVAEVIPSFAPPAQDDGAVVMQGSVGYGTYLDLESSVRTETELISRYRSLALQPEVNEAISEIVNESIVDDDSQDLVDIDLDELEEEGVSKDLREKITEVFKDLLALLKFEQDGHNIFRNWYVDGRLYYHLVVDKSSPGDGIIEINRIDPRKIRKIREITAKRVQTDSGTPGELIKQVTEYFLYSEKGFGNVKNANMGNVGQQISGLKIAKDAICYATSGVTNEDQTMVLSWLHVAIKRMNQLRAIEDAVVIYRIVKAPERRVWYVDVGNLPRAKAEAYIQNMMTMNKNRVVYDAQSGAIRDDRKYLTLYDDYWLATREGGRGTKVEKLEGGDMLGKMDDVLYFQKQLYKSLNVPISRLMPEDLYVTGRSSEISREEVKFSKFIDRLRRKFAAGIFTDILGKQLALLEVMSPDDFDEIAPRIRYKFARDAYHSELVENEVWNERLNTLSAMMPYIGRFFSNEQVRKKVLRQTVEEMEDIDKEIENEADNPQYQLAPPEMPTTGDGSFPIPEEPMPSAPPKPPEAPKLIQKPKKVVGVKRS